MKGELYNALLQESELVSMVGKMPGTNTPCIYFNSPKSHHGFPAIAFFESSGQDSVFADDVCIAKSVVMQVDVWAETDISPVFDKVDEIMRSLDYVMASFCDVPDVNLRHVQAVYKKVI